MKKFIFLLVIAISFSGCVSTSDTINKRYDEIKDVTYISHKDLDIGMIYNLRDSLTGERENIRVYIANQSLYLSVNYQYNNWAFFTSAVFLANGERVQIPLETRTSKIVSGSVVREQYDTILNKEQINDLLQILNNDNIQIAFIGDNYTTDKLKLPSKTASAIIDLINIYNN